VRDWNRFPNPPVWRRAPRRAWLYRLWAPWCYLVVWEATERYACFGPRPDLPGLAMSGYDYWTHRSNAEWRRGAGLVLLDAWRPTRRAA
jgi:hypothetical protein